MQLFIIFFLFLLPGSGVLAAEFDCPGGNGVINQDANLRNGPGIDYEILTVMDRGTRLISRFRQEDWVRVELIDSPLSGWVHFSLVTARPCQSLDPPAENVTLHARAMKRAVGRTAGESPQTALEDPGQTAPDQGLTRIGVLDLQKVINQSRRGRAARARYDELRRTGDTADLEQAEEELITGVILEIREIVEAYAVKQGYSHIMNKNSGSIFYNDPLYNITDEIIREYDSRSRVEETE